MPKGFKRLRVLILQVYGHAHSFVAR
jgi:hypothetical protein